MGERRKPRLGANQSGFTLIELMVAMALALVVGAAAMTFMIVTFQQQNTISSRSAASDQAEQGLEQLVRDLREAITSVNITTSGTSTAIAFYIPTPGSPATGEQVTWTCPSTAEPSTYYGGVCTRALTPSGGSTTTKPEIVGVQSMAFTPISSGTGTPSYPATPTSSPTVAAVGMTLTVQITKYELSTCPAGSTCIGQAKGVIAAASGHPIVLQATADLQNFT